MTTARPAGLDGPAGTRHHTATGNSKSNSNSNSNASAAPATVGGATAGYAADAAAAAGSAEAGIRRPGGPAPGGRAAGGRVAQTGAVLNVTDQHVARWRQVRSLIFVVLLTVAMFQNEPRPGVTGQGLALTAGMVVGGLAWVAMTFRAGGERLQVYTIGICMAAGIFLAAVRPGDFGACYCLAAVTIAATSLPLVRAAVLTGAGAAVLALVQALVGASIEGITIWVGTMLVLLLLGIVRREREARSEQDRKLAGEQARTATLAERARLAREIHDVLAHSLSALSLQLETAAALLERDRAAEAAVIVDRAGRLARDGLTETRRAVSALRGDPVPLPELVGSSPPGTARTPARRPCSRWTGSRGRSARRRGWRCSAVRRRRYRTCASTRRAARWRCGWRTSTTRSA
ncbi:sensor histidine kinase [Dactylosporangium darangshiense]|uniref:sensor histidine kinase n=1 Tax=Dactylosporangium darangshiense TaxID=579108 RepID=UPI00363FE03B